MKLTMELTLDGLLRALRGKAHQMAEDIESGYARRRIVAVGREADRERAGADDDVGGA